MAEIRRLMTPLAVLLAIATVAAIRPGVRAEEPPDSYALPGQDEPKPFVPLHPRTTEDRKRVDALRLFSAARAMEEHRRWTEAIDLLEQAIAADPDAIPALRRLGKLCFALGRTDRAIEVSRKVIAVDPNDTAAIAQLVNYYANRKADPAAAEALLNEVLANPRLDRNSPGRLVARFELGRLYAGRLERLDKAAESFAEVVEALDNKDANRLSVSDQRRILGNDEAGAYLVFGQVFLAAKKADLAIRAFSRGLVYDPDHPLLPLLLAQAQLDAGRGDDALAAVESYLTRQPQGREGYDLLVRILVALKREAEILPRIEAAARLDSKNASLQYLLADRYREAGQAEKANAIYKVLLAAQPDLKGFGPLFDSLLQDKKTDELLKLLDGTASQPQRIEALKPQFSQLAADPAYAEAIIDRGLEMLADKPPRLSKASWLVLIRLANEANKLDKLLAIQRGFLAQNPSPMVFREIADTLIRLGRYDEAAASIEAMLGKFPDEKGSRLLLILAQVRRAAGKLEPALESAREALKLDPNDVDALNLVCTILAQTGKIDEAIEAARAGLKVDPAGIELNIRLGLLLNQAGKIDEEIAHFRSLVERFPDNDELVRAARSNLSIVYTNQGDFAKGEAELEALLARDPEDPGVNNDLGYLYADQGKNLDKAEGMIRKAIESEPDNGAYLDSLGWVYFKRGKVREALDPLEKATKLIAGGDPTIFDHLGDVYFQLKELAKAKTSWARAEELAAKAIPPDKRLGEIRKKLKALESLGSEPRPASGANP